VILAFEINAVLHFTACEFWAVVGFSLHYSCDQRVL